MRDFVDEVVKERTAKNPKFPRLVRAAKRKPRRQYPWGKLRARGSMVRVKNGGVSASSAAYQYAARGGFKVNVHVTPSGTVEVTRL